MGRPITPRQNPVILRIQGRDLPVPRHLWRLLKGPKPDPQNFLTSDGCSVSPDRIRFLTKVFDKGLVVLFPACFCHDAHYRRVADLGGNWTARRKADWYLGRNLFLLCRAQGISRTGASTIAGTYWIAVRRYGASSFVFDEGQEPLSWFQRWREILLAFRSRPTFE